MSPIQWKESYSIGNETIDRQHRQFFAILQEAHDKLIGNVQSDLSALGNEMLTAVSDYTRFHFSSEETHMKETGYPDYATHKKIHQEFVDKVDRWCLDIHQGKIPLNTEIIKLIENWLIEHILSEDQKIRG
jgi:hemerythrin